MDLFFKSLVIFFKFLLKSFVYDELQIRSPAGQV